MISKVRFGSDIHLEFAEPPSIIPPPRDDEILILDGDTIPVIYLEDYRTDAHSRSMKRRFERFCESIKGYKNVYFIMGNHEYYNGYFCDGTEPYRRWFAEHGYDNFIPLYDEYVELNDDWLLIGGTLWTDMNKDDPNTHDVVGRGMNDFNFIRPYHDSPQRFTTWMAYQAHLKTRKFIFETASKHYNKKIIVATHHIPSYQAIPEEHKHDFHFNGGYYSDLEPDILLTPNIKWWIHGHNHFNSDFKVGNCNIISNQRGYPPSPFLPRDRCLNFDGFSFDLTYIPLGP